MERVRTMLCAAALAALPLSAHAADEALTLNCGQPVVYVGKVGTNPATRSVVTYNNPTSLWSVVFYLANGTPVYREAQYSVSDTTTEAVNAGPNNIAAWQGRLNSQPNLVMHASIFMDPTKQHIYYGEWLYDANRTDASGKTTMVMHSISPCNAVHIPDSVVAGNRQRQPSTPAPAPTPKPTAPPLWAEEDSIGIASVGTHVQATIGVGSYWAKMTLDTGASEMSVVDGLAQKLLANGEATPLEDGTYTLANGAQETEKRISIKTLKIGTHELRDVPAGIVSDGTMMLLPFPVLNLVGKFTIDTVSAKLIFG
jgi:gag-polyprotein putative aspartyl protease